MNKITPIILLLLILIFSKTSIATENHPDWPFFLLSEGTSQKWESPEDGKMLWTNFQRVKEEGDLIMVTIEEYLELPSTPDYTPLDKIYKQYTLDPRTREVTLTGYGRVEVSGGGLMRNYIPTWNCDPGEIILALPLHTGKEWGGIVRCEAVEGGGIWMPTIKREIIRKGKLWIISKNYETYVVERTYEDEAGPSVSYEYYSKKLGLLAVGSYSDFKSKADTDGKWKWDFKLVEMEQ